MNHRPAAKEVAGLNSFEVIENLLEELLTTYKVKLPVAETLIEDVAIVGITTFVGSLVGGSWGAVVGSAVGTGILASKYMLRNDKYKPLMAVLREDLTEEERNSLYERLWEKLEVFITCDFNQVMDSDTTKLKKTVTDNSDFMKIIENGLNETFGKQKMIFA